jgi:hypothetical protein
MLGSNPVLSDTLKLFTEQHVDHKQTLAKASAFLSKRASTVSCFHPTNLKHHFTI